VATFKALETLADECGMQDALFNLNGIATVHHSRYSREDRPLLDAAVEQQIGKHRTKPSQACIVVGTQTLEQSLDIDADLLITDLCPMDVLLQRVGRLHRHHRACHERPANYRQAQAIVLVPAGHCLEACLKKPSHGMGRFHKGGGIYMDLRILEATRRLISGVGSHAIPQDNRELVERATHPEALADLEKGLGSAWAVHGQRVLGEELAARAQGNHSVLDFTKHFWMLDEDLCELDFLHFLGSEQQISSRLGAGDYLLTFDPPQPGPFGGEIQNIPVRPLLWPKDLPHDTKPVVQTKFPNGGFTFTLGKSVYQYSRLGLERMRDNPSGERA
jgi:CRISPR-associated endonuclease/helicase Cas3